MVVNRLMMSNRNVDAGFAVVFLAVLICVFPARAQRTELPEPVGVLVETTDSRRIGGHVHAYDSRGLEIHDLNGDAHTVAWADIPPAKAYAVYEKLIDRKSAESWHRLSQMMANQSGGGRLAKRALTKAVRLDPHIQAKMARATDKPTPEAKSADDQSQGPKVEGKVDAKYWGALTDEQMTEAVEGHKAFARRTEKELNIRLQGFETKYFLFVTDLPPAEADKWAKLLDKMYNKLCDMFDVDRGTNIWRGKCLVFTFADAENYRRFQRTMHKTDPGWSMGMCHNFGDGAVHIAFYRANDEMAFAKVLVHEATHGFLHRYRTPKHIVSWANEGLAEVVSEQLVPDSRSVAGREKQAIAQMREKQSVGADFFADKQIEPWQYGVASLLTKFMISQNRKGYIAFVNAIKDGAEVDDAFTDAYGAGRERVLHVFGREHRIHNLRDQ